MIESSLPNDEYFLGFNASDFDEVEYEETIEEIENQRKTVELLREEYNIVMITLDSLSHKTYELAKKEGKTQNIDSLGKVFHGISPGTFTLPSHVAFFGGHFPQSIGHDHKLGLSRNIRLFNNAVVNGKNRKTVAGKILEGKDLFSSFRTLGYNIRSFGGTVFFEKSKNGKLLGPLAEYFSDEELDYFPMGVSQERSADDIPLGNIDRIAGKIEEGKDQPWFLFINDTATHSPYHLDRESPEGQSIKSLLKENNHLFKGQINPHVGYDNLGKKLEKAQIKSLGFVDKKLGILVDNLKSITRKKILMILCGDHGECFGNATFFQESRKGYFGHCWNGAQELLSVPLLINILEGKI